MAILAVGKRGVFDDSALFLVGIFVFAVMIFVLVLVFRPILSGMETSALFNQSGDSPDHKIISEGNGILDGLDIAFIIFYIGLSLTLIISALFLDSHPVFFFFVIIIFIIVVILSAGFSNFFERLTTSTDENMINATETLSSTVYLMGHLPLYIMITLASAALVFFAKIKGSGGS